MELELVNVYPTNIKDQVRKNAIYLKHSLDTDWASTSDAEVYKKHLRDRISHPTLGRIARREFADKISKNHDSNVIWRNEQIILNQDSEANELLKTVKTQIAKLYPKTRKAREYIIKTDRVVFDSIKKAKHYNWFDRLGVVLTKVR